MKTAMTLMCAGSLAFAAGLKLVDTKNLQVEYNGTPLISGEWCGAFSEGYGKGKYSVEEADDAAVYNSYLEKEGYKSRRELCLANGELEINVQTHIDAYRDDIPEGGIGYGFKIPMKSLKDAKFTAIIGRSRQVSEIRGIFRKGGMNELLANKIRQLYISAPWGNIAIDCDPQGINCFGDYGPNHVVGLWTVRQVGDELTLSIPLIPRQNLFYSGDNTGKVVIYAGNEASYDQRHSHRVYPYFAPLLPERNYAFGSNTLGKAYVAAGKSIYAPECGYGWLNQKATGAAKQETYGKSGALYSALCGKAGNTFRMSGLRQGFHLVTVACAAGTKKIGPFDISCDGCLQAEGISVEAGTAKTISFGTWVDTGTMELSFAGKEWCVSTIGTQLLQSSCEDYTFRRGFWRGKAAPYPSDLMHNEHFAKEPAYSVKIETLLRPESGKERAGELKPFVYKSSHAKFASEEDDWRFGNSVYSIGMGNTGSFSEFDDEKDIQRRIEELKAMNAKVLMFNGFLSRHTFPNQLPQVNEKMKHFSKLAHANGMKVMDHIDFSLLWNMDSGFRVLSEQMPALQMTLDTHLPARGFCLSNEKKINEFFDEVVKSVKECELDGIMIDELCFHGGVFCGCEHCRKAFHEETGWYLPLDETSPELFNNDSVLWRVWNKWRQKKIGDTCVRLKERIHKFNKEFVWMGYTTHYGLTTTYGTIEHAVALEQLGRGWDYIGTEIMPRNVFSVYRSVAAYRRLKNYFNHSLGLPVYGEIYTAGDYWQVGFFGWALNNLNGQTTWEMVPGPSLPPGSINQKLFTEANGNMPRKQAKTLSKVALYFSPMDRDWPKYSSYIAAPLGCSMMLNDWHIEHDFLTNVNFTQEKLAKYDVLIINNALSLSDEEVAVMLKFAENGGTLMLTHRSGIRDGNAEFRKKWAFADVFGGLTLYYSKTRNFELATLEGKEYAFEKPVLGIEVGKIPATIKKYGEIQAKAGVKKEVAAYEVTYGKGRVIYTPLEFGNAVWVDEQMVGIPFKGERYPVLQEAAARILAMLKVDVNGWNPGNTPQDVLTGAFSIGKGQVIHFLNASGIVIKSGEKIPPCPPEPIFPQLKEDISFAFKKEKVTSVYAVSPEFSGKKPLKFQVSGNEVKVTLPKELFKAYVLVYAE